MLIYDIDIGLLVLIVLLLFLFFLLRFLRLRLSYFFVDFVLSDFLKVFHFLVFRF